MPQPSGWGAGARTQPTAHKEAPMAKPTLRTKLCDILGIEYPIVLAGMGGVARHRLVAAISDAGGLGIIGAAIMGPDELRDEIRKVRELTDKPFGVDILLPSIGTIPQNPGTAIGGPVERSE